MTSIGETLRGERVRRHLDIQEISSELKIPAKFLEAIEQEQFAKLPGSVFAKSFVRQYGRYLGLPEEELVEALQRLLEPPASISQSVGQKVEAPPAIQVDRMAEWESVGERRQWSSSLPALALVVVAMLACSGVYAWWQRNRHSVSAHEPTASAAAPVPEQEASRAVPQSPSSQAPRPGTTPAAPPASADPGVVHPAASPAAANPAAAPLPNPSPSSAATAVPAAPPGPVHVQVTASSLVWMSAKADDKTSFTGTLEASQSRTIDAQQTVLIRLGNAGGADIMLNGKSIGPVGPNGQPRTVQLTSGGFQIVAPPKPPDLLDPLR